MKAWIVTVDMGLGHQRATYPLSSLAEGGILTVETELAGTVQEARLWSRVRRTYELISRCKSVPLIGPPLFALMDNLLSIPPYYPIRDLSAPDFQVRLLGSLIDRGLCSRMLEVIRSKPLPLITSYLAPAIAADRAGLGPVYCIICDAEVARAWVSSDPGRSRIHYLAPCLRTVARLRSYGVPEERISLTGFPLPRELLGDQSLDVLKADLRGRLFRLDPCGGFRQRHGRNVDHFLGRGKSTARDEQPLTITFAVGGAGAQAQIGRKIAFSLRDRLQQGTVRLNLVAGVREEVRSFFAQLKGELLPGNPNLRIVFGRSKPEYFRCFSEVLHHTDVLWTKPSELSFYSGLGIPIILAPPIGSQELYNRSWLLEIGAGVPQQDPEYTGQWLFDLLASGRLAEISWNGFLNAPKSGTYNIMNILDPDLVKKDASRDFFASDLKIA
ncbi:MAG: hypothetical protein JSV89_06795 [Spirochaetaceae bacterium]|nr:MAG: hypothetical protein JSV89_06795 [Spirochaetaceae bacterium]